MERFYKITHLIFLGLIILMIVNIEVIINKDYAPENILIMVNNPQGLPEENADCKADIVSEEFNTSDKQLAELESIYDFVDPNIYSIKNSDKGYYFLETGFVNYEGEFEIKIVCYSPGYSGVSYTIINNTNKKCEIKDGGKLLVC